jgi:alpha-1,6-mannosyltransferase
MPRGLAITACMLAAAAVSWARYRFDGRLDANGAAAMIWPFAIVGTLAAIAGWWHVGRASNSWNAALAWAIAIHVAAGLALPLTSNDLWSNIAYGRVAHLGGNPFEGGPAWLPAADPIRALVDPRWATLPSPYGPIVMAISIASGAWRSPWVAMIVWKALIALAAIACVLVAARLVRDREDGNARFVLYAWCPLVAWELAGQAHNDAVLVLALFGFVAAAHAGRERLAMSCLALGIAAKFVAAPVAGLYLAMIARRSPVRAISFAAALAGATVAMMLPWWHGPSTLTGLWTNVGPQIGHTARSIGDLLYWACDPLGPDAQRLAFRAFSLVGLAASATIGLLGIVRARAVADVLHYALLLFLVSDLFAQTWFQPWYITWLFPLAITLPDRKWLSLVARYAALTFITYAAPIDPISNAAVDLYIGWRVIVMQRDLAS